VKIAIYAAIGVGIVMALALVLQKLFYPHA
jgi:hypothetical protein